MNKGRKLLIPLLCAALALSGCSGADKPAESTAAELTTAAADTTATAAGTLDAGAEITTTAAKTTTAAETTTTAAETTTTAAETTTTASETKSEKPRKPASISAVANDSLKNEAELYSGINVDYSTDMMTDEYISYGLTGYGVEDMDKHIFFNYKINDSSYRVTDSDNVRESLEIDAGAADIYVRASTCAFSEDDKYGVERRIHGENLIRAQEFPSAYDIKWIDPQVTVTQYSAEKPEYYDRIKNENERKFSYFNDLFLGWYTDDPVTVNAFVCETEGGMSVLVDPEYMYGLPMFRDSEYAYRFGSKSVLCDSLLFFATPVEGMSLDTDAYAYAKVVLTDVSCTKAYGKISENSCTIADIQIIDTFDDIIEYNVPDNTEVIAGEDKDPVMQMVYNALISARWDLLDDTTVGIVLLDLDFDGIPEVLVSDLVTNDSDYGYDYVNKLSIWRVKHEQIAATGEYEDCLVKIDTLELQHMRGDNVLGFIGLSELRDGTPAWYVNETGDDDALYTLKDYELESEMLFTVIPDDEDDPDDEPAYYYRYDRIEPTVTMGRSPYSDDPDDPEDWEYLEWNGIKATFGMWELFGFARADYANNKLKATYPLYSGWLGEAYSGRTPERYTLTDREYIHKLAYLVDDFFYGGTPGVDHYFWFLGAYAKPVIYLYPEEQTDVSVKVQLPEGGRLTTTYPDYGEGWNVTAMPDGTLYDANGNEYYCLFWEGTGAAKLDMSRGFCVRGEDTAAFLREKLMYIGLTAREANEFIIYWLPQMQDNPYNIVTLHTSDYAAGVPLDVSPAPDTQIRVFMTFAPSDEPVETEEQNLPHYERTGFTLVEWGGCEVSR